MTAFLFFAAALVAVALVLLLRPWQRSGTAQDASAREINTRIYRDQLAELDRDLAAGTLAPADHVQAREELQRRLLDDAGLAQDPAMRAHPARQTTLLLALALPLAAAALYALLGSPAALTAPTAASAAAHPTTAADVDQMVTALAARLEKNPDPKGFAMLGRSYHAMGRMAEAKVAFERVGDALQSDPSLLADYADVLATLANGELEGRPLQLVKAALQIDPNHTMALSLAATAAFKRKDFAEATRHWEHLLSLVPPGSEEEKWLRQMLAELRGGPAAAGAVAQAAPTAAAPTPAPAPANATAAADGKAIGGQVSLAPDLKARTRPDDTVFIFARAVDGSRAPLAVQRARVADLPLRFRLDDSMAMNPQNKISDAKQLRIEARVSRDGSATPGAGDLIGASEPVQPGNESVALTIDRVRP